MTSLTGEELEQFLESAKETFQNDTEWLRERGWTETEEIHKESGFEAKIWISPSGRRCVHCTSMVGFEEYSQAVDVAHGDLLKELGWGTVEVHHSKPRYAEGDDINNPVYEVDPEDVWAHYAHPESGKVYMFLEAIDIARNYNNDEQAFLEENGLCGKTEEVQKGLEGIKLVDGDKLHLKFVLDKEDDHHHWVVTGTT